MRGRPRACPQQADAGAARAGRPHRPAPRPPRRLRKHPGARLPAAERGAPRRRSPRGGPDPVRGDDPGPRAAAAERRPRAAAAPSRGGQRHDHLVARPRLSRATSASSNSRCHPAAASGHRARRPRAAERTCAACWPRRRWQPGCCPPRPPWQARASRGHGSGGSPAGRPRRSGAGAPAAPAAAAAAGRQPGAADLRGRGGRGGGWRRSGQGWRRSRAPRPGPAPGRARAPGRDRAGDRQLLVAEGPRALWLQVLPRTGARDGGAGGRGASAQASRHGARRPLPRVARTPGARAARLRRRGGTGRGRGRAGRRGAGAASRRRGSWARSPS